MLKKGTPCQKEKLTNNPQRLENDALEDVSYDDSLGSRIYKLSIGTKIGDLE